MVFRSVPLCRVSSLRCHTSSLLLLPSSIHPIFRPTQKPAHQTVCTFHNFNAKHTQDHTPPSIPFSTPSNNGNANYRWRPMCLYYTQGKCTKMDDPVHLEMFNHDCSRDLPVIAADFEHKRPQDFDYFLVLDLEGKVEILEFPVFLVDARTMAVMDLFHRFVMPSAMSEQRINEYIGNKYGKFGVDRVWHDTALPFNEVIQQFEIWLTQHLLWEKKRDGCLNRAAFVTCGNWDVKTQIPHQCQVSKITVPLYFSEWINLKDAYKNFYNPKKEARGMRSMMEQLDIPMLGSHHLGVDDAKNIARVLLRMLADGAVMRITARKNPGASGGVKFLYKNRVR